MEALGEHGAGRPSATGWSRVAPWTRSGVAVAYALVLAIAVLGWGCWRLWSQVQDLTAQLEHNDSNLTLSVQTADQLFQLALASIDPAQPLTDEQRQLLRTWVLLDDQFYEQNRDAPELRFECATALLRIGQAESLLGSHESASQHLEDSLELLNSLLEQRPRVHGLRQDAATAARALGQCRRKLGDPEGAIAAFEAARALLVGSKIPLDTESGSVLLAVHESLAAACLEAENHSAAASALTAALRVHQRMWKAGLQDPQAAARLAELQVQLVSSLKSPNDAQQFEETLQESLVWVQQVAGLFPDQAELQRSLESLRGLSSQIGPQ